MASALYTICDPCLICLNSLSYSSDLFTIWLIYYLLMHINLSMHINRPEHVTIAQSFWKPKWSLILIK